MHRQQNETLQSVRILGPRNSSVTIRAGIKRLNRCQVMCPSGRIDVDLDAVATWKLSEHGTTAGPEAWVHSFNTFPAVGAWRLVRNQGHSVHLVGSRKIGNEAFRGHVNARTLEAGAATCIPKMYSKFEGYKRDSHLLLGRL